VGVSVKKRVNKYIKHILIFLLGALAVLSITMIVFSISINISILNEKHHERLFDKYDIYDQTHSVIDSAIQNIVKDQIKYSPNSYKEHKEIFDKILNSSTPESVRNNLISIRTGLFKYFQGKTYFLPDIQLGTDEDYDTKSSTTSQNSQQALSKIDKINLSAILMYINRNDITEYLSFIKFFYFLTHIIPYVSLIVFLFCLFIVSIMINKTRTFFRWLKNVTLFSAAIAICASIALVFYCLLIMPANIEPIVMSFPYKDGIVSGYIKSCALMLSLFIGLYGIIILAVRIGINYIPLVAKQKFFVTIYKFFHKYFVRYKYARITVNSILAILLCVLFAMNCNYIVSEFSKNNYKYVLSKITHANTVTEVIAAKDDTIYDVNLKVVDKKSNTPVSGLKVNISGKSSISGKSVNEVLTTDEEGSLKSSLDKGTYKITFISESFPEQYDIPTPFFFELKESGTKVISVALEESPEYKQNLWGIVEIEVIDDSNEPVSGLQLEVLGDVKAPGDPDRLYAYTNSDGIAVFKLYSGTYKIGFNKDYLQNKYKLPPELNVDVQPEAVARYTYRLQGIE